VILKENKSKKNPMEYPIIPCCTIHYERILNKLDIRRTKLSPLSLITLITRGIIIARWKISESENHSRLPRILQMQTGEYCIQREDHGMKRSKADRIAVLKQPQEGRERAEGSSGISYTLLLETQNTP